MKRNKEAFRSWKAIANYFGRSERTVRRWEALEGLPVHRHQHRTGARIFARKPELDAWFSARTHGTEPAPGSTLCLALIPFDFFSAEPSEAFIQDAFCEDIVGDLSGLTAISLISYASAKRLPQTQPALLDTITSLRVDYYIEGSIRILSEQASVNVRVINASEQTVAWSAQYCESRPDWQALRQKVVADLITSLPLANIDAQLFPQHKAILHNQTAWEYLHKARNASLQWQPEAISQAITLLQAASELVGNNPLIMAQLGRVYLQQRESGADCSAAPIEKASAILKRLRAQQPHAFFTLSLGGWLDYMKGEINEAIDTLRQALALQPNDPDTLGLLSNCYLVSGQSELAWPFIQTLQVVDPLTPLSRCMPGYYRLMTGDFDGAIGPYQQMLTMAPSNPLARLFLVWALAMNEATDAVVSQCEGFLPSQRNTLVASLAFALCDGLLGHQGGLTLTTVQADEAAANAMLARFTAFAFAGCGDIECATHWLRRAFELGFWPYPFMHQHDRYFRPYADYEPLKQLMVEMEKKWRAQMKTDLSLDA
ncbi:hypothetical protein [Alteromonas halophila]|uniref:Tetratricopeptide repeat protein n=1 Tax=Alteromonas halophila TaxID=516698 RepID=A0A918JDN8_9ALTE|nr:hypothetical protein [Alteromonas halophila]GGW75819.1 hypothetical protein GCM10007391_05260 [Alteromonas halophila]